MDPETATSAPVHGQTSLEMSFHLILKIPYMDNMTDVSLDTYGKFARKLNG